MPATVAQPMADCPLFKLPPELRNRIYEYAVLVELEPWEVVYVQVTKEHGIPEPGLLATCKNIRKEAIGIYYQDSFFVLVLEACDSAPIVLWKQKTVSLLKQYNVVPNYPCKVIHRGHRWSWKNFNIWLQRAHQGTVCGLLTDELDLEGIRSWCINRRADWKLMLAALETAETMRDQPWTTVEKLLYIDI